MTLEIRRSRFHAVSMIAGMLVLAALAAFHVWEKLAGGEVSLPALLLLGLFGLAAFYSVSQHNARAILIAIGPEGLDLPGVAPQPIAWRQIREIRAFRSRIGARLDLTVDADVFTSLRLGHRWTGDFAVKARHLYNGFSIHLHGMDRGVGEVETAIRRHWKPVPTTSDEE